MSEKIEQLIPDSPDGVFKNINEFLSEYRKGNVQCMMLCFRRKKEKSTRTYFIGADDPYMFQMLVRLEHDMLGLYDVEADVEKWDE